MKILIEAHHPAHVHFWKYPIRELQNRGHEVLMIARDRDVMRQLLDAYDWITAIIPPRFSRRNRFPVIEMLQRQFIIARQIAKFRPAVVASLMGSYTQSAKLFGVRNIIFTDTETQAFNHRIAHPFADEIHTPYCFYLDLGGRHHRYKGLHELSFLDKRYFRPDSGVLTKYNGLSRKKYVIVRMSSWNTLHDVARKGIGDEVHRFIDNVKDDFKIIISAEEGKLLPGLEEYCQKIDPVDFHSLVYDAAFVLTEGASTAAEAACMGTPSVFVNSVGRLGNFDLLDGEFGLLRSFGVPGKGVDCAIDWLKSFSQNEQQNYRNRQRNFLSQHIDVTQYVVNTLVQ